MPIMHITFSNAVRVLAAVRISRPVGDRSIQFLDDFRDGLFVINRAQDWSLLIKICRDPVVEHLVLVVAAPQH